MIHLLVRRPQAPFTLIKEPPMREVKPIVVTDEHAAARAQWVADLFIMLSGHITDARKMERAGYLYDLARHDGIMVGIDRMATAAESVTTKQAGQ